MHKTTFLLGTAVLLAGLAITFSDPPSPADSAVFDVVISGGRVMDPESGIWNALEEKKNGSSPTKNSNRFVCWPHSRT